MKRWTCCLLGVWVAASSLAQPHAAGERLSDWILRQNPAIEFPIGLIWQVPQERAAQTKLKQTLLESLSQKTEAEALSAWLAKQDVTGRVVIPNTEALWLKNFQSQDPLILPDQVVRSIPRPQTVTVLRADASICQVQHTSGVTAKGYVDLCAPGVVTPKAWVAQPDGRSAAYGIALWNAEAQDELAPGAWVWAPPASRDFSDAFSQGLIRFLASLGAAPDGEAVFNKRPLPTPSYMLRKIEPTASNWGEIGLIQTPSARMGSASAMRVHMSKVLPYTATTIMFQPMDWLETGFRYVDISNRRTGSVSLQTDQTYKDKSIDFKLRLREESSFLPAVAVGVRDVGGTGLFSSEYFVANKRWGDVDASLGLGWGYMASSGNIANPFGKLNPAFNTRPSAVTTTGGELGAKAFFRGPAALFGGLQWRASDSWAYKLEREGNNYQNEPLSNPLPSRSQWNFAANYRFGPATDFAIGWERGNKLMIGVSFHADLDGLVIPKLLNPPVPTYQASPPNFTKAPLDLGKELKLQTDWDLIALQDKGVSLHLEVKAGTAVGMHRQDRLNRLNGLIQAYAADRIRRWEVIFVERGLAIDAVEIDRDAWMASQTTAQSPALKKEVLSSYEPKLKANQSNASSGELPTDSFKLSMGPSYNQVLGGLENFLLYKIGVDVNASYRFNASTWIDGTLDLRLADNYSRNKFPEPITLPPVRSFAREYLTTSRLTMPVLQATHVSSPSEYQFTSLYAGMLESMFAGVGGEWLYRPARSPLAFGIDINHVYQRDFRQHFTLRDYHVTTGHATAYLDTGISGILLKYQLGQYLAGDRGATVDISRRFDNGVILGAYVTKTNVSAIQFGEGSFDKGIYISFPFDATLPKFSDRSATALWQPLLRDGGARLNRLHPLYNLTSGRDSRAFDFAPKKTVVESIKVNDEKAFIAPTALTEELNTVPISQSVGRSVSYAAKELTHPETLTPWFWAAAAVVTASAFDNKADRWALNHSQSTGVAKLGNAIPLLLGLGALATAADDGIGMVSLKAAGIGIAASVALRTTLGRSRPEEGHGNQYFAPFSSQSDKSGLPSNHVVATAALVTPFAQAYDAPWLYGLIGVTAIGRVQARQHWLSDTVAGGVLGFAIGSVLTDEFKQKKQFGNKKREFLASPNSVAVRWWW
jgi:membrane-associated phospholipid phosphatase